MTKTLGLAQQSFESLWERPELVRFSDKAVRGANRRFKKLESLKLVVSLFENKPLRNQILDLLNGLGCFAILL